VHAGRRSGDVVVRRDKGCSTHATCECGEHKAASPRQMNRSGAVVTRPRGGAGEVRAEQERRGHREEPWMGSRRREGLVMTWVRGGGVMRR
jgi:hypothetical protein